MDLGLSGRQARVYLALLRFGVGDVRTIAALSLVHRQEVYRLLERLQTIGLVQRNVSSPATFKATPIDVAVKVLLERKSSQLSLLNQQAKQLTKILSENNFPFCSMPVAVKPYLGTVVEADRGKKYRQALLEAERSIDIVTTWLRFKQLSTHFEAQLQNALKRDVAVCIVSEKPRNQRFPKWVNTALSSRPNFKVKTQPDLPLAAVTLFDCTEAVVAFDCSLHLFKGPDLWTRNKSVVALCQAYFKAVYTV